MSYTTKDLAFILYNNRSLNGVIKNFLPKYNPLILQKIESDLDKCKSKYKLDERQVLVNINEFDLESEDVYVTKEELKELSSLIFENIGSFSESEFDYLTSRGIGEDTILQYRLLGISSIKDYRHLEILGATCHPTCRGFLEDGIEHGGIIIPLFDEEDFLVNCAIRKINSHKSLKYSLACPDVPVWGIDNISKNESEIWICEGIFDMIALRKLGKKSVSCSSAMWSGLQLYKIIQTKPQKVCIFSDNDEVGLRTSGILKDFFTIYGIECNVFISRFAKDPAEHYFQKERNLSDLIEIEIDENLIQSNQDESFNFIEYLKNRKY
jgi:hypothetical protein